MVVGRWDWMDRVCREGGDRGRSIAKTDEWDEAEGSDEKGHV